MDNINDFREFGKTTIDFIANYLENIRDRDVLPSVEPGEIMNSLPSEIPEKPEDWRIILKDIEDIILPGLTHWQSPHFHAYFPSANSAASIIGELLIAGIGVLGFSWICSPACTELEVVVMDWLAKFLNLPSHFLHSSSGPGGGIIQGSASESVLVSVISAREQAVKRLKLEHPKLTESKIRGRLVAYSSDQSNSCVEKASVLAAIPIRLIPAGDDLILHGDSLLKAVEKDIQNGKFPVICIATLGTTGTCAFDDIASIGPICQKYNMWLHVDAAYAGGGLALPELSHLHSGFEYVESIDFNLHKFMMVNFDCSAMWFRDANKVVDSFNVDRIYLKHKYQGQTKIPDFRHWQIPLGRRFRALKVWITFRTQGQEGLRAYLRKSITLAAKFEEHIRNDPRFEMFTKRALGLVCFRIKGENHLTTGLLEKLSERKKLYLVQAEHKGTTYLRFVICGMDPQEKDIQFAWNEIAEQTEIVIKNNMDIINGDYILKEIKKDYMDISEKFAFELNLANDIEKIK